MCTVCSVVKSLSAVVAPEPGGIHSAEMEGRQRSQIKPGVEVDVVLKEDQRTGRLTRGVVQDVLTRSSTHPHGIQVRLTTGEVGRVKRIVAPDPEP